MTANGERQIEKWINGMEPKEKSLYNVRRQVPEPEGSLKEKQNYTEMPVLTRL